MHRTREHRDQGGNSPIKWILLIAGLLAAGAWAQNLFEDASGRSYADSGRDFRGYGEYEHTDDAYTRGNETRALSELTDFEGVSLRGAIRLEITIGDETKVSLHGAPDKVQEVRASVEDGKLVLIREGRGWFGQQRGPVTAKVTVPALGDLNLSGATSVHLFNIEGGNSKIVLNGAARMRAKGHLDQLNLVLNGASSVNLRDLTIDQASVVVNGAGNIRMNVRKALTATVNGAGHLRYTGDPEDVTKSVNGIGSIKAG